MSVYNAGRYLWAAIESILAQTYHAFELIIVDDGSQDESAGIIKSFDDPRIVLISRPHKGLTYSLNEGIARAAGIYVARHDADDSSMPTRFERQVRALEADPALGLIGTNYIAIDEQGNPITRARLFTHPDDVKAAQGISNQYCHGSVMLRKHVLDVVGGYDPSVGTMEDYDLFIRVSRVAKIGNLAEPLYLWRRNPAGITLSDPQGRTELAFAIRDREFAYMMRHRNEYRLFSSFHPFSDSSPRIYLDKKSAFFRDLAFLSWHNDAYRWQALGFLLCATLLAPWRRRNLRCLRLLAGNRRIQSAWRFEWL